MVSNDSALLYIALSILYSNNKKGLVPETCFFLNPDQIISFVKSYGGKTIYIPTADEFYNDNLSAMYAYYNLVEGKSIDWFQAKYDVDKRKIHNVVDRVNRWLITLSPEDQDMIKVLKENIGKA